MSLSNTSNSKSSPASLSTSSVSSKTTKKRTISPHSSPPKDKKKNAPPAATTKTSLASKPTLFPELNPEPSSATANSMPDTIVAPGILTYNPFTPLAAPDEMPASVPTQSQKIPKPPPIYLKNVTKYADLCKALTQLIGPNCFTCKARATDLIIQAKTVDGYRQIIHYLREKKAEFIPTN
uniref:Uncharacterized protein n=1 Tax=Rhodnius prolixus TaxID=13249 RepID=T1HG25_RHOPR